MNKNSVGISSKDRNLENCKINTSSNIKIFHQNVQSLGNKKLNIEAFISEKSCNFDVMCITEHWLGNNELELYNLNNFTLMSKFCRKNKKHGGSCIFVKSTIESIPYTEFENLNIEEHFEASMIELPQLKLIIICIYRTPTSNIQVFMENLDIIIHNLLNKGKKVIIMGDLNVNFLVNNNISTKIQSFLNTYGLEAIVNVPTRIGNNSSSAVDQIILNKDLWNYTFKVITTGFSDHDAQTLQLHIEHGNKINSSSSVTYKKGRSFKEENIQYLNYLLAKESWDSVFNHTSVNLAYEDFHKTFSYCYEIALPETKIKLLKHTKNWVTTGIRESGKRLRFLSRILKNGNVSKTFKDYYLCYKKIYTNVIREAKKLHNDKFINSSGNKSKALWTVVKNELGKTNRQIKNMKIKSNDREICDPQKVANIFNDYYATIAETILDTNSSPQTKRDNITKNIDNCSSIFLNPTNESEIIEIINQCQNKKSSGIDGIPDFIIKRCCLNIVSPITFIVNLSLSTGCFPDRLKIAKVKPVYKKGSQEEVKNYRPISLLSVFSRIIEKVMHKRLVSFLTQHNIIVGNQHGFCKGKSTNTAIMNFLEKVYDCIDKAEMGIGLFLDLSKAFDLVDHTNMLEKLKSVGIRGVAHKWFSSYLKNRKQKVEISYQKNNEIINYLSEEKYIGYGVPQGSVLGPILFLIYINDLESYISHGKPTFFADDTSIFISGNNINNIQLHIEQTINQLTEWFTRNRLIVNKEKTIAISFHHTQSKNSERPVVQYQNEILHYSGNTKFLGVWLDEHLKWSVHIHELVKKLSKICFALRLLIRASSLESARTVYFAYFHSVLTYGVIFWGNSSNAIQIFKLQKRAIRAIVQVSQTTSCRPYFKTLRILPLPCIYIYEILNFVKSNINRFPTNSDNHSYNTRNKNNIFIEPFNTTLYKNSFMHTGLQLYNSLPNYLKEIPTHKKFKTRLYDILSKHCFYSVQEFTEICQNQLQ